MENRLYEGWEVIKILSEGKLQDGHKLRDNLGNEFKAVKVGVFNFLLLDGSECKSNVFTYPDRKFYLVGDDNNGKR